MSSPVDWPQVSIESVHIFQTFSYILAVQQNVFQHVNFTLNTSKVKSDMHVHMFPGWKYTERNLFVQISVGGICKGKHEGAATQTQSRSLWIMQTPCRHCHLLFMWSEHRLVFDGYTLHWPLYHIKKQTTKSCAKEISLIEFKTWIT